MVEAAAPAPGEPMDINTAVQLVLKKALAHDGLSRGLHEAARAIEKGEAQLCILAEDCNQPDYKKLIEALCAEHNVNLITIPENKQLGEWAGLCKLDAEGTARKVRGATAARRLRLRMQRAHRGLWCPSYTGCGHGLVCM